MDWSIGSVVQIGLRIIARRSDIERLWGESTKLLVEARRVFPEVVSLVDEIAPGLVPDLTGGTMRSAARVATEPPPKFDVPWLQESINTITNAGIAVTGEYDEPTRAAVTGFQRLRGLRPDGWAGALTEAMIQQALPPRRRR